MSRAAAWWLGLVGLVGCVSVEPTPQRRSTANTPASPTPASPTQAAPVESSGAACAGAAGLDAQVCGDWHKGALGLAVSAGTHRYSWASGTEQAADKPYEVCGPEQKVAQPVLVLLDVAGSATAACFHFDVKPTHDGGRIMRVEQLASCCEALKGSACNPFGGMACEQRLRAAPAELHGDFSRK
jgi:hypothetical protein